MTDGADAAPRRRLHVALILTATFLAATCGFIYQLVLISMGANLIGNAVTQTSYVIGTFVAMMGVGSLLVKWVLHRPLVAFAVIEVLLAVVGGASAFVLYWSFAWLDTFQPVVLVLGSVIGILVGAELPLLVGFLRRVRRTGTESDVADLLASDYLGALVAGVAFPLVLLPALGNIETAIVAGILNLLAAAMVVAVFARSADRARIGAATGLGVVALAVLVTLLVRSDDFEVTALQQLYDDPVVLHERTPYQDIVMTRAGADLRLYLNGDLQFASPDEYRYHETLTHPALNGDPRDVLLIGGGDGLAAREILKHRSVRNVTQVELDPRIVEVARTFAPLRRLNADAPRDARVHLITRDAFSWARDGKGGPFDAIIVDLPDPDETALAKLYSREFYAMLRRYLRPGGTMIVQSGSPYFAPRSYRAIELTLRAAGWRTTPYHVDVPSFGDWGFHAAALGAAPEVTFDESVPTRFLSAEVLRAALVFPKDRAVRGGVEVSTLDRPTILSYAAGEWRGY